VGIGKIRTLQLAIAATAMATLLGGPWTAGDAPFCQPGQAPEFTHGFAQLSVALGTPMGEPTECAHVEISGGDIVQRTTTGTAYYRRTTNVAAFTDGALHRAWTERGLVTWTGNGSDAPGAAVASELDDLPEGASLPEVGLETIFGAEPPDLAGLDPERLRTLVFTGDIGLVRMVNVTTVSSGDFIWPFRGTAEILRAGDLTVANLEGSLLAGCELQHSSLEFCGDPRNVEGLEFAGIDVVGLSNNHIFDHGGAGLESTRRTVEGAGIDHTGEGVVSIQVVDGVRFGFVAYNLLWGYDPAALAAEIAALKRGVDVVVAIVHWGAEYTSVPLAPVGTAAAPRDIARTLVAAGADLVLGNHPHWVQAVEVIDGVLVAYAHGNFIFDQQWSPETLQGVIGRYTFYDAELVAVEYLPVHIQDWGQPWPAEPEEAAAILAGMQAASERLLGG
jgi:hypothetical protein